MGGEKNYFGFKNLILLQFSCFFFANQLLAYRHTKKSDDSKSSRLFEIYVNSVPITVFNANPIVCLLIAKRCCFTKKSSNYRKSLCGGAKIKRTSVSSIKEVYFVRNKHL